MNKIKPLYEISDYKFSKRYSLLDNIEYLARKSWRLGKYHREAKETSTNLAETVFHGVTSAQQFHRARILKTIAKELKLEKLNREN